MYVINTSLLTVAKGFKSFNYKNGPDQMGEWITPPELTLWSELPKDLVCHPAETWLTKIKPVLKDIARKRRDDRD